MMGSLQDGYRAVVFGSTGGIGSAITRQLTGDPRCADVIELFRASGFYLEDEASIEASARAVGQAGSVDLMIVATGALRIGAFGPEKSLRAIQPEAMAAQFAVNAIGPALILKHFAPLLHRDTKSTFAALSARVGSIGDNRLGGWISYRSSKAALNQIIHTAAIEVARSRPQAVVVAVHPGTVATPLSDPFAADRDRQSPEDAAVSILNMLDRLTPEVTGGFFAYDGSPIEW